MGTPVDRLRLAAWLRIVRWSALVTGAVFTLLTCASVVVALTWWVDVGVSLSKLWAISFGLSVSTAAGWIALHNMLAAHVDTSPRRLLLPGGIIVCDLIVFCIVGALHVCRGCLDWF